MGKTMQKYFAIFLALVACHVSLQTHARKIKPSTLNTIVQEDDNPKPTLLPPKISFNVPSPSEKELESTLMPNDGVSSLGASGVDTDAFRPTTPGSSPGVGHRKFFGEDKDMKVGQCPNVKASVTAEGSNNAIKPTNQGHSPGVGHILHSTNGKLN